MSYLVAKALHFVGFISWFAGLFYIVRLFVYHAEASERPESEREVLLPQLELMAARLWKIITVPAMIVTFAGGIGMVVQLDALGEMTWLHIKFGLLGLLVLYTHACGRIRKRQAARTSDWTSRKLRVFNEGATMLMVAIVFLAVFRQAMSIAWGVGGLLALGIVLMLAMRAYRRALARKPDA